MDYALYRPYYEQWKNDASGGTPTRAEAFQNIEDGLKEASKQIYNLPAIARSGSYVDLSDKPSKNDFGLGNVDNVADTKKPISDATKLALSSKVDITQLGAASGAASLDNSSRMPLAQLPLHAQNHKPGGPDDLSSMYPGWSAVGNKQGAGVASLTNGVLDKAQLSVQSLGGGPQPFDHGLSGWTMDPACMSGATGTPQLGQIKLMTIFIRATSVVPSIYWNVGNAASNPASGKNWVGIYDVGGNLLSSVGVDGKLGSGGMKIESLSKPLTLNPGRYWIALLFNGDAAPSMYSSGLYVPGMLNANLSLPRFGTYGTGSTSLPSTLTVSSINPNSDAYWCALGLSS